MTWLIISFASVFGAYISAVTAPNTDTALQGFHIVLMIILFLGAIGSAIVFGIALCEDYED